MPAYKIGTSERVGLEGGKETSGKPGPGAYESTKILGRTSPVWGMGTENRPGVADKSKIAPGPGAYSI